MDRKICGVCGGLGEYLGVDSTVIRLIFALITFFGVVPGCVVYLVAAIIMPDESNCH